MASISRFLDWCDVMLRRFLDWAFWSKPIMLWTAHAAPAIWVVAAFAGPLLENVPWMWLAVGAWSAMLVAMLAASMAEFTHEVQLCTRCAANMPSNATVTARLVRALLWMHHYKIVALLLPMCALTAWKAGDGMPSWLNDPSGVLLFLGFGAFAQALLVHRAHRVWCPYCDGWDGDPDAPVEPVLDPPGPGRPWPAT